MEEGYIPFCSDSSLIPRMISFLKRLPLLDACIVSIASNLHEELKKYPPVLMKPMRSKSLVSINRGIFLL